MTDNLVFFDGAFNRNGWMWLPPESQIDLDREAAELEARPGTSHRVHLILHGSSEVGENGGSRLRVYPDGTVACDDGLTAVVRGRRVVALRKAGSAADDGVSQAMRMMIEFHRAFNLVMNRTPQFPASIDRDTLNGRVSMHLEESRELVNAIADGRYGYSDDGYNGLVDITDALADVVYVAYGTALTLGIDLDAALAEVHDSNMSKLGEDGRPLKREDGKVLKGPGYRRPDLKKTLTEQAPLW